MRGGAATSLALLRERVARIPAALARDLARPLPDLPDALAAADRWVATGTGGSEGPARAFVAALQERGFAARFRPLSSFALGARIDATVVLFSQGLSPNARIALRGGPAVIVTAVAPDDDGPAADALRTALARGAVLWPHGPRREGDLLVRIEGPTRATLAGLRLAGAIAPATAPPCPVPPRLAAAVEKAGGPQPPLGDGPVGIVVAGDGGPFAHGLRWKLLEALGVADPPVWDVLQVAHGPLQQFYEDRATLLCLEAPGQAELFDRLARTLVPERHEMRRLRAGLAHPFSWFEHDAELNAIVRASLERRPRDLIDWPGKGRDASLYELTLPS